MQGIKLYSKKKISSILSLRKGENKLGEDLKFLSAPEELAKADVKFVIFGIPEDIGVRANYGKPGTSYAWEAFLKAFVNVQQNRFIKTQDILLLGEIDTLQEMEKASNIDEADPNCHRKLGDLTRIIDEKVSFVVYNIMAAGKTPIIIGGGHNNAYGNLKGASQAFGKPVNVLNIDAHTDLRNVEYRHSGNGFSFALKNKYLKKYSVFGLHQNYTPEYIFEYMENSGTISYSLLEELRKDDIDLHFRKNLEFVNQEKFGLELDCDAIAAFPSSAVTPTGFSLNEVREFVKLTAKEKKCCYLHICEAISKDDFPTGKALSYLVTDFIKAKQ